MNRRHLLGALAIAPVAIAGPAIAGPALSSTAWDKALEKYEQRKVLYDADHRFGRYFRANEKYNWMRGGLLKRYGTLEEAKLDPVVAAEWQAVWDEMSAAEAANSELYFYPMDEAGKALIHTPAPDARALEIKLEVMAKCAIGEDEMDIMAIIQADVQRLASA